MSDPHPGQHADALLPLKHAEREELRQSIEAHGVRYPILVDQHGTIIDGHHRWAIAAEMGLDCPVLACDVDDDDEAAELAQTLNVARRHIDPATWATKVAERRQRVAVRRARGESIRSIAEAEGMDPKQVRRDLGTVSPPAAVTGKDGKSYPATRPTPVVADDGDPWDDTIAPDSPADMTAGVEPVGASVPPAPSSEHRQGGTEATPADEVDGYLDALVSPSVEDLFDARLNRWLGQVNDCRLLSPAETAEALSRHDDWWRRFTVIRADVDRWFATVDAARPPRLRSVGGTR